MQYPYCALARTAGALSCARVVAALVPDFELPPAAPDGHVWLTTDQAAAALNVSKSTISVWKAERRIKPHPDSPQRHPLYDYCELIEVEYERRQKLRADGHDYWAQRRPGLRKPRSAA